MGGRSYTKLLAAGLAIVFMNASLGRSVKAAESSPAPPVENRTDPITQPGSAVDIVSLLPVLLSSEKSKLFAADIKAAIRKGDMGSAERQINDAVELGTLAMILMGSIRDPKLPTALQSLDLADTDDSAKPQSVPNGDVAACTAAGVSATSKISELQESLDQEKRRGEAAGRELTAVLEDLRKYKPRSAGEPVPASSMDVQEALRREQERAETAIREAATIKDSLRDVYALQQREQTSAQSKITELQGDLEAERERAATESAQLRQALKLEEERRSSIARELETAHESSRNLQALQASGAASAQTKISELQDTVERETARSEAANHELAEATEEIHTLRASWERDAASATSRDAQLQEALRQEQERVAAVTRDITVVKDDLREVQELQKSEEASALSKISELMKALEREKKRGDEAVRALAIASQADSTRQALREHTPALALFRLDASGAESPMERVPGYGLFQIVQYTVAASAAAPSAASGAPVQDVKSSCISMNSWAVEASPPTTGEPSLPKLSPESNDVRTASIPSPLPVPRRSTTEATSASPVNDRLVMRAEALIQIGDISGARLLLERAQQNGNPRAAFLLAETFDPLALSKLGIVGIRGDAQKAREGYARALALGVDGAAERIEALK